MALHQTLGQNYHTCTKYKLYSLQQYRLAFFGTGIFRSESWNDSLGSKDNGSSSIKKKFSLSESMSLSRERKGNRANYCFAQSKRKGWRHFESKDPAVYVLLTCMAHVPYSKTGYYLVNFLYNIKAYSSKKLYVPIIIIWLLQLLQFLFQSSNWERVTQSCHILPF